MKVGVSVYMLKVKRRGRRYEKRLLDLLKVCVYKVYDFVGKMRERERDD